MGKSYKEKIVKLFVKMISTEFLEGGKLEIRNPNEGRGHRSMDGLEIEGLYTQIYDNEVERFLEVAEKDGDVSIRFATELLLAYSKAEPWAKAIAQGLSKSGAKSTLTGCKVFANNMPAIEFTLPSSDKGLQVLKQVFQGYVVNKEKAKLAKMEAEFQSQRAEAVGEVKDRLKELFGASAAKAFTRLN